jgi:hypothetical protein
LPEPVHMCVVFNIVIHCRIPLPVRFILVRHACIKCDASLIIYAILFSLQSVIERSNQLVGKFIKD